ncbi:chymotrypsinogen B-like [Callorhinchus milii]|uniref:chymotrypsinogen B-like n=1 Tax=Callorhinchus milii TaxID=7868 RepID=UPI0004573BE9|nr:chymotrypsinogen B-like [Callorhinchus milii]|eukprot:gi/632944958/ref/XP_007887786.1/ PREDICTED: chymotrypsinogen B-like [Callorhinchus milii]
MALFRLLSCLAFAAAARGCGIPAITTVMPISARIANGEVAAPGSWPWQASIQDRSDWHFCGGSLIQSQWVITAAQCGVRANDHRVILGVSDRNLQLQDGQIMEISKVIVHPQYNPKTMSYDMALLKLEMPVTVNDHVSTVCLPTATDLFPSGMFCTTTGWGLTNPNDIGLPTKLHQASLPLVSKSECEKKWGSSSIISDDMLCAGGAGATSCLGDAGSPLVCEKNNAWYLVGVVSWGTASCNLSIPAVYARVTQAQPWIDQTIAAN